LVQRIANGGKTPINQADASHDIVIVGGGIFKPGETARTMRMAAKKKWSAIST